MFCLCDYWVGLDENDEYPGRGHGANHAVIEPSSARADHQVAPGTGTMVEEGPSPAVSRSCAQQGRWTRTSRDLNRLAGWENHRGLWDGAGQVLDVTCMLSAPCREESRVPFQALCRLDGEKCHAVRSHWVFVSPAGG